VYNYTTVFKDVNLFLPRESIKYGSGCFILET
jgi:hypothetical protein